MITEKELKIFSRQLILNDFNEEKFNFIQKQHLIIIGIGGIGCPIAQYLIATGIKHLTLIDDDIVQISNLNRQILFNEKDLGKKKIEIRKKPLYSHLHPSDSLSGVIGRCAWPFLTIFCDPMLRTVLDPMLRKVFPRQLCTNFYNPQNHIIRSSTLDQRFF